MTTPPNETAIAQPKVEADSTADSGKQSTTPSFGWNQYAEQTNGRFAMIGFVALLITNLVTRQDFFTWLGLR